MTDQITIPRETFDQMQRALEVLNHLDADINFLNTKELEEMVDKALSAAKEVDHMPDAGKMVQPKLGVAVGELASPEYDQLRAKVQPTAMPFVPWSKEAEMLESWAVQPQAQGEAERLYDAIEDCLLNYRLHGFVQDDGDSYPLVDHLSHGDSIEDGRHEIRLICDSIYNTVLKPAHPQASEPAWRDIATAPKDGTWILLAGGECEWDESDLVKRPVSAQWTDYLNGKNDDRFARWQFCWYDGGYYGRYENPTHWMPLPAAPGVGP